MCTSTCECHISLLKSVTIICNKVGGGGGGDLSLGHFCGNNKMFVCCVCKLLLDAWTNFDEISYKCSQWLSMADKNLGFDCLHTVAATDIFREFRVKSVMWSLKAHTQTTKKN